MAEIYIDGITAFPEVTMHLTAEAAGYIAQVMEEEHDRTSDAGAFNIARIIKERAL